MQIKDAVDWHTKIASEFDEKYSNSKYFKERFIIWKRFIDKYSNHNYSVLDLGCGSGTFTFYLAEINRAVIG
ncbi:MAG TPA: class I SAM-dependent methyltransferase, partial [Ignavibacteria bacterium]|nr:class I SAM-dependent methyltransferase [Ignavibacteria bacterium]